MIRLAITLLHTALALGTTSAALLLGGQARANSLWEQTFYGRISEGTLDVGTAAVFAALFGFAHGASAVAWFVGIEWGGWTLIAASVVLASTASWGVVALLASTTMIVSLDVLVQRHRAALGAEPPTR